MPCVGSKVSAEAILPTSTMKLLSCRARAQSCTAGAACPLKSCRSHACRLRWPMNRTVVAALMLNFIGAAATPCR
eukprot:2448956-Rhodomonas_salina.1